MQKNCIPLIIIGLQVLCVYIRFSSLVSKLLEIQFFSELKVIVYYILWQKAVNHHIWKADTILYSMHSPSQVVYTTYYANLHILK